MKRPTGISGFEIFIVFVIIAALAMLAGCSTWTHPTKGPQAFDRDYYDCERDAAPGAVDPTTSFYMRRRCMQVKGWKD